jgi:O-antigen ligase
MTTQSPAIQILAVIVLVLVALLAGNAVGTQDMAKLLVPAGGLIVFITLVNPFASLIIFLLVFMRVGSYEQIGAIQIGVAGYTVLLFLVAFARFLWREGWDNGAARTVTLMFVLMGFLSLSVVVAVTNHIAFGDWGRGAFPLVVLCLAAVFATTVHSRAQWNMAALVFLLIVVNLGAAGASALGGRLGAALGLPDLVNWGSTVIPATLTSLGVAMMIEKRELHWGYMALVALGLVSAVLTPTRTVWISAGLTVLVLAGVVFVRQRRPGAAVAIVAIAALVAGGTLLAWRYSGPTSSWEQQTARFSTLEKTSEDPSVQIRKEQLREAIRVFESSPLIGAGLGYEYQYHIAFTSKYEQPNDFNHSDLANALAKTGLLGTALIYAVLISAVLAAVRLQKTARTAEDRAMGLAAECTLIVALVIGNSTPMLQEKGSAFILALIIGLVLARLNLRHAEQVEEAAQAQPESEWPWERGGLSPYAGL